MHRIFLSCLPGRNVTTRTALNEQRCTLFIQMGHITVTHTVVGICTCPRMQYMIGTLWSTNITTENHIFNWENSLLMAIFNSKHQQSHNVGNPIIKTYDLGWFGFMISIYGDVGDGLLDLPPWGSTLAILSLARGSPGTHARRTWVPFSRIKAW
jgi:hypothetical protein